MLLFEIALALIVAKLLNILFEKMNQPGAIGEIITGIILGPCLLGSFTGKTLDLFGTTFFNFELDLTSPEFKEIAVIGTIFLMFIVGMETDTEELKKSRKAGFITCVFGVIVPFFFGVLLGLAFNFGISISIAIGTIFVATSIGLTIRVLAKLNLLSTRIGLTILTADIMDDILGIFILALALGTGNPLVIIINVLLFFTLTLGGGFFYIRYSRKKEIIRRSPLMILTAGLVVCFLFSALAENIGLTGIIGAFIAGILIRKVPQTHIVGEYANTIGYAFFIPLFFVWVGASFDFNILFGTGQTGGFLPFLILFVLLALLGKVIGCFIGAKLSGLTKHESYMVGIGMMPRMGVALIVVTTEIDKGLFGDPGGALAQQMQVATLLLVLVSVFITPALLKRSSTPLFMRKNKRIDKIIRRFIRHEQ